MGEHAFLQRVMRALGVLLIVCLGIRVAGWLIQPVLPMLGVLALVAGLIYFAVLGPRSRH